MVFGCWNVSKVSPTGGAWSERVKASSTNGGATNQVRRGWYTLPAQEVHEEAIRNYKIQVSQPDYNTALRCRRTEVDIGKLHMYMDENGLVLEGPMTNDPGQQFTKPTRKKISQTCTAATAPRSTATVTPVQMSVLRFETLTSKPKRTQVDPGFLVVDKADMLAVSLQVVNYCSAGICGFPKDVSLSGHHDGVLSLFTGKNEHKPTMLARWFRECVVFFKEYVSSDVEHFFNTKRWEDGRKSNLCWVLNSLFFDQSTKYGDNEVNLQALTYCKRILEAEPPAQVMGDLVTLFVTIMSNFCPESTPERKFIGSYTSGNRKARMEVGLAGTLTLKEKDQEVYFKISPYLNVLISADGSLFEFKASGKCTWDKAEWKRQATGESGANTDGVVGHLTQSVVTAHHEPQVQNKLTGP